jgi:hypothetical protein
MTLVSRARAMFGHRRPLGVAPDVGVDLARMAFRPGASRDDLADVVRQFRGKLPQDYIDFMAAADGGEGWVGSSSNYLILWRVIDLWSMNRCYQVDIFAPGLVVFGTSGWGDAYAFDRRAASPSIVAMPFVEMKLENVVPVALTFPEFLKALSEGWDIDAQ